MKFGKIFCNIFVLIIKISLAYSAKSHPISTLVNAKFSLTPIQLEIAEFLSDSSNQKFWNFVDELAIINLDGFETDFGRYNATVNIARSLLSHAQTKLLKFSLSLRSLTIRIQSHFMIADDVLQRGDCPDSKAFVMFGSELTCSAKELRQKLKNFKNNLIENSDLYSFDHIYPGSETNSLVIILYGEIGSKDFNEYHNILKTEAQRGLIKYVTRHYIRERSKTKVRLSGYGVELHLKSTEYKAQDDSPTSERDSQGQNETEFDETEVDGFDFKTLKSVHPHLSHSIDKMKANLLEKNEDIAPLKAWEFQELGLQAAHRIATIQGEESLSILQFMAQNFPSQARSLLNIRVSDSFKAEMKNNIEVFARNLNLQPPDAALFINGLYFDAETLDAETLLDTLKKESSVLDGLKKIALHTNAYSPLLALDFSLQSKEFAIDIRDSSVIWINDLESDKEYKRWGSSVMDMLRPTFPGMMRSVRKNFFNLILVFDPIKTGARDILRMSESFIANMAPIRFGIVLDTRSGTGESNDVYRTINCAFNYMHQKKGAREALIFLLDVFASTLKDNKVDFETVQKTLKKSNQKISKDEIDDILGEDSDFDYGRQLSEEFIERLGVKQYAPQALLNGVLLNEKLLNQDEYEELILTEIMQQTVKLQKKIYMGELTDDENVIDYLMQQPHVMLRLNQRILSSDDQNFLDMFSGTPYPDIEDVATLQTLNNDDLTATLMKNLRYFETKNSKEKFMKSKLHFLSLWVVTDLNTKQGKVIMKNALNFLKSSSGVRLSFIPNADKTSVTSGGNKDLNEIMWSILYTLDGKDGIDAALQLLNDNQKYEPSNIVKGFLRASELHLKMLRVYCQRVLKFRSNETSVIANGKIYGSFEKDEYFTSDDFNLLEKINQRNYVDKIKFALKSIKEDDVQIDLNSEIMLKLLSLLMPRQSSKNRFNIPSELREDYTVVKLPAKAEEEPAFNIVAVLDPASRGAQKLAPLLILLRQIINCDLKVFLNAIDKHSDMPVKNFYRYVIEPELQFSPEGKLMHSNYAKFVGLPANHLLTQNLAVPENWMADLIRSVYDLDNIRLADIGGPVHSEYELEFLLLEGHCFDSTTGSPPRGLQFILGTKDQESIVDTIVMANLGYFQLKANPGAWILQLRHGKSSEIYDITNVEGSNTIHRANNGYVSVVINSFRSHVLKVRVTKKPDKLSDDLLVDDESQTGIWDSITSTFSGTSQDSSTETINIFSVASGHLYERLLRIMMLSLLKHTKSPVKFWFLKNYLSPQFKDFLPAMSQEYNFQYELVQYKWPRWLHQQTEKQRTIWGYKILFLDVLFPLDIKKIIFVDADQIVRADIRELYNMDLNGAPYAYTPFCSDRTEMDGFRFWNSGYWRNHLQGRKYHISALYVVDLKKFRKIAAGDRLRGQYQALSQDANSLANLDQDLPNNMIHQVPIKSLPQEWLWCETWCSDESIKHAKTIDLCNNPMTKEAKLSAAQRIVPEWKDYDAEIKNLMARIDDEQHQEQSTLKQKKDDASKNQHTEL